jgi:hypothetical protein
MLENGAAGVGSLGRIDLIASALVPVWFDACLETPVDGPSIAPVPLFGPLFPVPTGWRAPTSSGAKPSILRCSALSRLGRGYRRPFLVAQWTLQKRFVPVMSSPFLEVRRR